MMSSNRIDQEAAQWAVRLALRALTPEERLELDRWVESDPRHCGALLRARAIWTDLDRLAALSAHPAERDAESPAAVTDRGRRMVGLALARGGLRERHRRGPTRDVARRLQHAFEHRLARRRALQRKG